MNHTETDFARRLGALAEVFGETLSAVRIAGYWEVLGQYEAPDLNAAFGRALRECKFFPKPAELIAFVEQAMEMRKRLAPKPSLLALPLGDRLLSAEEVDRFMAKLRETIRSMPAPAKRDRHIKKGV